MNRQRSLLPFLNHIWPVDSSPLLEENILCNSFKGKYREYLEQKLKLSCLAMELSGFFQSLQTSGKEGFL
ncbi:hypothetical protein L6452_21408 [Arctium lappa]|uniref:Uncharacterized protein n=1 Tax=Arctium lappa TaxID=4217 RepID=A0ACB9AWI9_ARCLA|nr:hypothetical protein L6452_21408 [Arctium lappa]